MTEGGGGCFNLGVQGNVWEVAFQLRPEEEEEAALRRTMHPAVRGGRGPVQEELAGRGP